jgi:hypothetical protein
MKARTNNDWPGLYCFSWIISAILAEYAGIVESNFEYEIYTNSKNILTGDRNGN